MSSQQITQNASMLKRLASMLYESLLLIAVLAVATFIFILMFGDASSGVKRYLLQIYLWMIAGAYFIWCWLRGGQTLAMQTWKIRVVQRDDSSLNLNLAVRRYAWATVSFLLVGAGFIWGLFDREGLFLHDRLSGCKVVNSQN